VSFIIRSKRDMERSQHGIGPHFKFQALLGLGSVISKTFAQADSVSY